MADCMIQIDTTFVSHGPFFVEDEAPRVGRIEVETYTGGINSKTNFFKENLTIEFAMLTEGDADALRQIVQQTGSNATHTLIYQTPELIRKWDGSTAAGSNINTDINRVRKKVLLTYDGIKNIPGWPNLYNCVLHAKET